ncbi:hypothetical protein BS50DRAFT_58462 [Corynespora cassiicola Philippines]|uniref:Uncharacterized protein n=1 Tax=Corynespora cassiicola Philippines TaxID=1448308 RepID=A0A2T2NJ94_CORCC|nr:hypothetical protein BS50DRAFT_58462 [Corynespora cassiicola Philippines]
MMSTSVELFSDSTRSVFANLDQRSKSHLINVFWPHIQLTEINFVSDDYIVFFDFIGKTLQDLRRHAAHYADQQLDDLLATIEKLRKDHEMTRSEIVAAVQRDHINVDEKLIRCSIELAAYLWSGIYIRSKDSTVGNQVSQETRINWPSDQSLARAIAECFKVEKPRSSGKGLALDGSLTAIKLRDQRGVEIIWTDNLADHLKLHGQRKDRSLTVFRQKSLLINHRLAANPIIPIEVLDEAVRTLDLLFPLGDEKTAAFLKTSGVHLNVAGASSLQQAGARTEFKYWKDEILQLNRILEGPPETIGQTLRDTRNFGEFVTIWVAIFGVFILTILFGILSTVYSVKQYLVAVKSYELSLALTCLENPTLDGFCT